MQLGMTFHISTLYRWWLVQPEIYVHEQVVDLAQPLPSLASMVWTRETNTLLAHRLEWHMFSDMHCKNIAKLLYNQ